MSLIKNNILSFQDFYFLQIFSAAKYPKWRNPIWQDVSLREPMSRTAKSSERSRLMAQKAADAICIIFHPSPQNKPLSVFALLKTLFPAEVSIPKRFQLCWHFQNCNFSSCICLQFCFLCFPGGRTSGLEKIIMNMSSGR